MTLRKQTETTEPGQQEEQRLAMRLPEQQVPSCGVQPVQEPQHLVRPEASLHLR